MRSAGRSSRGEISSATASGSRFQSIAGGNLLPLDRGGTGSAPGRPFASEWGRLARTLAHSRPCPVALSLSLSRLLHLNLLVQTVSNNSHLDGLTAAAAGSTGSGWAL